MTRGMHILGFVSIWFVAGCTNGGGVFGGAGTGAVSPAVDQTVTAKQISTTTLGGYDVRRLKLSLADHRDAYVILFRAPQAGATPTKRPTVLITKPYEGFDWSEDATDLKWSSNPSAGTGFVANDDDSVGYDPVAGGVVSYQIAPESGLFGEANYYLLHKMNVAFVFNRYYAGGNFITHARDTEVALRYLAASDVVDADRLGVYGLSWGGMTAALGVALAGIPVKRLVLQSPAIDVPGLREHYTTWVPQHVASSAQLSLFATFYAPYGRRIDPVVGTSLASSTAVAPLLSPTTLAARLAGLVDHTLWLADEWDTLVEFARVKNVSTQMGAARSTGLWWTHAATLDYETAPLGHNVHPTESLQMSEVFTLTQMEFAAALLPPGETIITVIYDMNVWNYYLNYLRGEQQRGVDISALTRTLIQISEDRVNVINQQDNSQYGPGSSFVSGWLSLYWGVTVAPSAVHDYLVQQGLPP